MPFWTSVMNLLPRDILVYDQDISHGGEAKQQNNNRDKVMLLPKDILKYAVKLDPEKIEEAILAVIKPAVKPQSDHLIADITSFGGTTWVGPITDWRSDWNIGDSTIAGTITSAPIPYTTTGFTAKAI